MPLPSEGQVLGDPAGKAYARYLGCYEQQLFCSPSNALADLTGGVEDIFELSGGCYVRDPRLRVALSSKMMAPVDVHSLLCYTISVEHS